MKTIRVESPATILYRGNLRDTAAIVGLAFSRTPIGIIAFTGELTTAMDRYCQTLSAWLKSKGLPKVSIHPSLTPTDLSRVVDRPTDLLGWGTKECEAAIRLAGLPLPPSEVTH